MIDTTKCEFEDFSCSLDEPRRMAYYFVYPKESADDLGMTDVVALHNHVVSICICVEVYEDRSVSLSASPTIEEDNCLYDCEWIEIAEDNSTIKKMLDMAGHEKRMQIDCE